MNNTPFINLTICQYMENIENNMITKNNILDKIHTINKKKLTISNDLIVIPCYDKLNILFEYNYNIHQLKIFLKHYKLKLTGTKKQLILRIYLYLIFSNFSIKIQKIIRGNFQRKCNILRGPALLNRVLCNNKNDFLSLENMDEINGFQFFSYKDKDNFIYGFDILSIYNLIFTKKGNTIITNKDIKNPYNRNEIPDFVISKIKKILKIEKLLKNKIIIKIKDVNDDISYKKSVELKALEIFQFINSLGNYSDINWFLNLDKHKLLNFLRELDDIWNFRAQIYPNVKRSICPPYGNPFGGVNLLNINSMSNLCEIQKIVLDVIGKLVNTGIDREHKSLGCLYVLSALTLVSQDAASTIPWLFESVSNNTL